MPAFWIVLAVLLVISSSLNAYQVVVVTIRQLSCSEPRSASRFSSGAALSVRKWLREREQ